MKTIGTDLVHTMQNTARFGLATFFVPHNSVGVLKNIDKYGIR